jgi:hypothetical protein
MDFIERWFGFSPDGGSGTTEMLFMLVGVALIAAFIGRRKLRVILNKRRDV